MTLVQTRGPRDRKSINIHDARELAAWAQHFGVSVGAIVRTVLKLGRGNPDEVAAALGV
jgi:hypothetical protein